MTKLCISLICISSLWFTTGCSEQLDEGSSKFYLKLPKSLSSGANSPLHSKGQNASDTSGQRSCFAINIKGKGLPSIDKKTCDPEYGQFLGFVEGGSEIALEVKSGENRTVELYYMSSKEPCPESLPAKDFANFSSFGSNRIHRLAKVEKIDISGSEVTMTLPINLPSHSNTLQSLHQFPTSCEIHDPTATNLSTRMARTVLGSARALTTDNQYKMSVRVGTSALLLQNTEHQIKIIPHHLGVDQ